MIQATYGVDETLFVFKDKVIFYLGQHERPKFNFSKTSPQSYKTFFMLISAEQKQ